MPFDPASIFYHHAGIDAYQCCNSDGRGCLEMIEVPHTAIVQAGKSPVHIKNDPLNRMLWLELQALDHEPCHHFKDAQMALDARKFRKQVERNKRIGAESRTGHIPVMA